MSSCFPKSSLKRDIWWQMDNGSGGNKTCINFHRWHVRAGGRGGPSAPGLPNSAVVFKNIEILKFALSNSHLTLREHWAYNWSGQCGNQENSVTTTWNMNWPDCLALNGAGMHGSTFSLNICFVAFSSHPGPGISLSLRKSNRGSAVPLNCPGNGWKPNLLSKQRIFMAQFFNPDIFHFSQLKIWLNNSIRWRCRCWNIWSMRHAWGVSS